MATTFPNQIQTFPQMMNILAGEGNYVKQYQDAMESGDLATAQSILSQISNNQNKIITADYLNTINDTVVAVEQYFNERYSPAYIVSEIMPTNQQNTDFWFQVTGTIA